MTIRDHLKARRKPFMTRLWVFGILAVVGGVGLVAFKWELDGDIYGSLALPLAIGVTYLVGCFGVLGIAALMVFRIRCPKCGKALGGLRQSWNHCPYCAVALDSEFSQPGL